MDVITKLPLALTFLILLTPTTSPSKTSPTKFILKSCKTATYPSLCVQTLTPYAAAVQTNRFKLCTSALSAAIQSASTCKDTVSRLSRGVRSSQARAINECVGHLKDAAADLKRTATAVSRLRGGDRAFQWGNAKTYGSAAITDADTCVDEVVDRNVGAVAGKKIRSCIGRAEKVMSNALYLINNLY